MASEAKMVPDEIGKPKGEPGLSNASKENTTINPPESVTYALHPKPPVPRLSTASADVELVATSQPPPALPEALIAVLGQTGTGKSSFINAVTGGKLDVGHNLASCTQTIQCSSTVINGQKVTLIDTPGFDESAKDDGEILTLISIWLRRAYKQDRLLNGVIYLHRIEDKRMQGGSMRSLMILKKLCGTKTYENIVLATTMWDLVEEDIGLQRERELETKYWEVIIEGGGKVCRHDEKEKSARKIVMDMLPNRSIVLGLQAELEQNEGIVSRTAVGEYVRENLERTKRMHADEVLELKTRIESLQKEQMKSEHENKLLKLELRKTTDELTSASSTIEKLAADIQRLNVKIDELEPPTATEDIEIP